MNDIEQNLLNRIKSFSTLEEGWLDGFQGNPITKGVIDKAKKYAHTISNRGVEHIHIFPMENGGISFEYTFMGNFFVIEIEP